MAIAQNDMLVDFDSPKHAPAWLERGLARPAVRRGLLIPSRP
jgi:GST-like protein